MVNLEARVWAQTEQHTGRLGTEQLENVVGGTLGGFYRVRSWP